MPFAIDKDRIITGLVALAIIGAIILAVRHWRTSEKEPGDFNVRQGNYAMEDGLFDEAILRFEEALDRNPEHVGAHLGMAIAFMQTGREEMAREWFTRTIAQDPGLGAAYANRGILRDRLGKYEDALSDYTKALELDPNLAEGPGLIWRFLRNVDEKPPTIKDRAEYLEAELKKPTSERLLKVPEVDGQQRMYKVEGEPKE
jgi:tetratricopeptide (TPR) repeat protein